MFWGQFTRVSWVQSLKVRSQERNSRGIRGEFEGILEIYEGITGEMTYLRSNIVQYMK